MNIKRRFIFFIIVLFLFPIKSLKGQIFEDLINDCDDSTKYRIEMQIPDNSYKKIRKSIGAKLSFSNVKMNYNGLDIPVKSLKIRGKTTLYYPKKSFTVKLKENLSIQGRKDTVFVKDCYLLSLSMDQNYIVNYSAYSLLKFLNLFNLTFSYCELVINDETQGIYLLMERPRDYAFETLNSPFIIRRGLNTEIDDIYVNDKVYKGSLKLFRKKFMKMYALCNKYSGSQLYDSLNNYIDLGQYMRWLGFNFLVRNGDYTDEVFFYFDSSKNRFGIIPWDYDDLFVSYPHEGKEARRSVKGGQFIFSSEDKIDQAIISDEFLYKKYLEELLYISEQLSDKFLFGIFQKTYCSVYPYYLDDKILNTTQFDKYGLTSLNELYVNVQKKLGILRTMRDMVNQQVNMNNK